MKVKSADLTVVKSIKQRDLLISWLRIYIRRRQVPSPGEYQPNRFAEEAPDLVHYMVEPGLDVPRFKIEHLGSRMREAYGTAGDGQYLEEYLGPRLGPEILPIYYECVQRALPIYTIGFITDVAGRAVAHERLLLPFSQDGREISQVIASHKPISEEGGFVIKNLMRASNELPRLILFAVIDQNVAVVDQDPSQKRRDSGDGSTEIDWD